MHDLAFFRNNLEQVAARLATRGFVVPVESFRELDQRRRAAITETEELKARRNAASEEIARLRKQGVDTAAQQSAVRESGQRMSQLDEQVRGLEEEFRLLLAGIPNLPDEGVPIGSGPDDNVEVRRWGQPRQFDFEPKAHWDLGPELGILDLERAAKITGARFALYWSWGARLERALMNFMLDLHGREHGYTEVLPPFIVNSASLYGTGNLPKFAGDLFHLENSDLWLIPTAEVPVTNIYSNETLDAEKLPISLCAYTPCFRSEAGSHGRDVRGIIRQHQFQKVELVKFTRPDQSAEEHEKLTRNAEAVLQKLALPYRTMLLCTGDMGPSAQRTYDIEVWLPGQNAYKEISSCSNYGTYQARRAGIRCKSGKGKAEFAHTLNGSGLAVGRAWVAIIENFQERDGSVVVPEALRPYLGTERITPP